MATKDPFRLQIYGKSLILSSLYFSFSLQNVSFILLHFAFEPFLLTFGRFVLKHVSKIQLSRIICR